MDELLSNLANEESLLYQEISRLHGVLTPDRQEEVYRRYREIYSAYVNLALHGSNEALKRALFLQWYAQSEPPCYSGLFDLDPQLQNEVSRLVEALIQSDALDAEWRWMLPYYYAVNDWYFGKAGTRLLAYVQTPDNTAWKQAVSARHALCHRGAMGEYWLSIPTIDPG